VSGLHVDQDGDGPGSGGLRRVADPTVGPPELAGIDASGRLLLVTVDGRGPGVSEGLTLTELASLARQLGAREAMNLDGGGSTAMTVDGQLVTHPSDTTGERAVGDAVTITP